MMYYVLWTMYYGPFYNSISLLRENVIKSTTGGQVV